MLLEYSANTREKVGEARRNVAAIVLLLRNNQALAQVDMLLVDPSQ